MNDEQYFLANAYLDGELTADERRIAEADPEVMSEVESLRALQAELRDVPGATPDARDAAIAAAMAEFHAGAAVTTTESAPAEAAPAVVPFRPRPAYTKFLAVAAALVAVAGLGIVISQARSGGDDDAGDDAATAADAPLAATSARDENLTTIAVSGAEEATAEEATAEQLAEPESAEAPTAAADSAVDDAGDAGMVDEAAEEAAEPAFGADADVTTRVAVPPDFDPDSPVLNEIGLAIYGAYLVEQRELDLLGPTPETRCDGDYAVLDTAIYVLDGDARPVYIGVNEVEGFVLALDTETCTELAKGDLF